MITLTRKQEKELRKNIENLIEDRNNLSSIGLENKYYDYKIISDGARGERVYFKKLNLFTGEYFWEANLTTTQMKEYFNIK
nr:MAG TPA: hypothetical protein [Caudoviricetes sp.]